MNLESHLDLLFNHHKLPCLLADMDTDEVLYINEELKKLMHDRKDIIGEKFYNVIKNNGEIDKINQLKESTDGKIIEHTVYDCALNMGFLVSHIKVSINNKFYHFCKFSPNEKFKSSFEDTMTTCINLLQEDDENKNEKLLKILGEFYKAESAYVFKIDAKNNQTESVANWTKNKDIAKITKPEAKSELSKMIKWLEMQNEHGILEVSNSHADFIQNEQSKKILATFNLQNLIMCVVERDREIIGAVAITNRENETTDLRLIKAVCSFMEKDIVGNKEDISEIYDTDILTNFKSRVAYSKKVEDIYNIQPSKLGIVFVNMNGLKKINSEYGYAKGDGFIKNASEIIKEHFKDIEFYRTSGDEFLGFFTKDDKDEFEIKVKQLQEKMKNSQQNLFAIGYAYGKGRYNLATLIREAETVMYINKQEYYSNATQIFDNISDNILSDLLKGLKNEEFIVYLQPQVKLEDDSLYGAEALVRRIVEDDKMVYPDQFVPLYEKKSIIRHIDMFVIEQVCKILSEWSKTGKEIPISVNLSRVTLLEYGIVDEIAKFCDKYTVDRGLLVIEVTERVGAIENNVDARLIDEFRKKGFKISLDDFGCAYSNIVTLSQIEVEEVKLDKSLVDNLATNNKNYVLVKNVLSMCNELNDTSTLAEGIEDKDQADTLRSLGCHLGQGYFYSKPISIEKFFEKYIK